MVEHYPPAVLRIEPRSIPVVRGVLYETVQKLTAHLGTMSQDAYLAEPWMGDSISKGVQTYYNDVVMTSDIGPFQAAVRYRDELLKVHDTLQDLENRYRAAEGENAEMWGRLA